MATVHRGIVVLLAAALIGCGPGTDGRVPTTAAILENLAWQVIVPQYEAAAEGGRALAESADAFCRAPTTESLERLRDAWREARSAWKGAGAMHFGPVADLRLEARIDWWPANPARIDEVLDGEGAFDASVTDRLGSTQRGLEAMEYLLWGAVLPPLPRDAEVLSQFESGPRACDYLRWMADGVAGASAEAWQAWAEEGEQPAHAAQLARAGRSDSSYESPQQALDAMVNEMIFAAENGALMLLAAPLGQRSDGQPQPDLIVAAASDRALDDLLQLLLGLDRLYRATEQSPGPKLEQRVAPLAPEIDAELRAALADAIAATRALLERPERMEQILAEDPEALRALHARMERLHRLLQADLASVLGITLGFNDNDGD